MTPFCRGSITWFTSVVSPMVSPSAGSKVDLRVSDPRIFSALPGMGEPETGDSDVTQEPFTTL
jgi:hypothetical protein